MRLWVSQNQATMLHSKITILYEAKSGRWNSMNCKLPSQLQKIVYPSSILRIVVVEELCNLSENLLSVIIQIACQASRETWLMLAGMVRSRLDINNEILFGRFWEYVFFFKADLHDMKNKDKKLFTSFLASAQSVSKLSTARHPGHTSMGSWQSSLSLTKPLIKRNTSAGESSYRRGKALLAESTKCWGKPQIKVSCLKVSPLFSMFQARTDLKCKLETFASHKCERMRDFFEIFCTFLVCSKSSGIVRQIARPVSDSGDIAGMKENVFLLEVFGQLVIQKPKAVAVSLVALSVVSFVSNRQKCDVTISKTPKRVELNATMLRHYILRTLPQDRSGVEDEENQSCLADKQCRMSNAKFTAHLHPRLWLIEILVQIERLGIGSE